MIDGGRLYLENANGSVGCFDAATGRSLWAHDMVREFGGKVPGWGYSESVLIDGNLAVITPGEKNCIVALDKQTGRPVWSSQGFEAGSAIQLLLRFHLPGRADDRQRHRRRNRRRRRKERTRRCGRIPSAPATRPIAPRRPSATVMYSN